jgi:hypothetical protein
MQIGNHQHLLQVIIIQNKNNRNINSNNKFLIFKKKFIFIFIFVAPNPYICTWSTSVAASSPFIITSDVNTGNVAAPLTTQVLPLPTISVTAPVWPYTGQTVTLTRTLTNKFIGGAYLQIKFDCPYSTTGGGTFGNIGVGSTVTSSGTSTTVRFLYTASDVTGTLAFAYTAPSNFAGYCNTNLIDSPILTQYQNFEDYKIAKTNIDWTSFTVRARPIVDITGLVPVLYVQQTVSLTMTIATMFVNGATFTLNPGTTTVPASTATLSTTTMTGVTLSSTSPVTTGPWSYTAPYVAGTVSVTGKFTPYSTFNDYLYSDWKLNSGTINTAYTVTIKAKPVLSFTGLPGTTSGTGTIIAGSAGISFTRASVLAGTWINGGTLTLTVVGITSTGQQVNGGTFGGGVTFITIPVTSAALSSTVYTYIPPVTAGIRILIKGAWSGTDATSSLCSINGSNPSVTCSYLFNTV